MSIGKNFLLTTTVNIPYDKLCKNYFDSIKEGCTMWKFTRIRKEKVNRVQPVNSNY
jgi:hypothetical protein